MKVGIVGASGFLGLNLTEHFSRNLAFEVFATSRSVPSAKDEIQCTWAHFDLLETDKLRSFLEPLDAVFYLAHDGNPSYSGSWVSEAQVNLSVFLSFMEAIKEVGKTRSHPLKVIYASSGGAIYGPSASKTPWKETDPTWPVSSYAVLKITAEHYLRIAVKMNICHAVCLRIANPYGNHFAHRKMQGLIDVAIAKLSRNEPVLLFTSDALTRDFISIEDLNSAFEASLKVKTAFEIINIGSGEGHTIQNAVQTIESLSGRTLIIQKNSSSGGFVPLDWSVLDISKAKSQLQWSPKISFQAGIEKTLKKAGLK